MLGFSQISLDDHAEFNEATTEAEVDTSSIPDLIDAESIEDEGTSYDYYNSYEHENQDNNSDACSENWLDFRQIDNKASIRASEAEDAVRWEELTVVMEKEAADTELIRVLCSSVYSFSKTPEQSLSRVTGFSPHNPAEIRSESRCCWTAGAPPIWWGPPRQKGMAIDIRDAEKTKLFNASDEEMSVLGQAEIMVEIPEIKRKELLTFLITKDLPETELVFIGMGALKQLKLLPFNWPHSLDFPSLEVDPKGPRTRLSREQVHLVKSNSAEDKDIAEEMGHNVGTIEDIPRLKKLPEAVQK
jgi:hypothetical protein